jgi:hypothetical protein
MAEPDAAGPVPISGPQPPAQKGSLSLTLADIQRDIDRATAPLRAAQRQAERSLAPVLATAEMFERQQQQIAAMVDRAIGPYLRTLTGAPAQKKAATPSQDSAGRLPNPVPAAPAFDASPPAMSTLVDTVAAEVLKTLAGSRTGETAAFAEEIRAAVADEVRKAFAEAAASKKDRKPRGETTCERMRDLHLNIDPEFAETASEPKLGKRIGRSPGTFPDSHYWTTVLQPKRRQVRAEIQEAKRKAREAQRWGHFDSVGRRDEDSEAH